MGKSWSKTTSSPTMKQKNITSHTFSILVLALGLVTIHWVFTTKPLKLKTTKIALEVSPPDLLHQRGVRRVESMFVVCLVCPPKAFIIDIVIDRLTMISRASKSQ